MYRLTNVVAAHVFARTVHPFPERLNAICRNWTHPWSTGNTFPRDPNSGCPVFGEDPTRIAAYPEWPTMPIRNCHNHCSRQCSVPEVQPVSLSRSWVGRRRTVDHALDLLVPVAFPLRIVRVPIAAAAPNPSAPPVPIPAPTASHVSFSGDIEKCSLRPLTFPLTIVSLESCPFEDGPE
jgi:hypothetical protein